jgi:subtilisin family serine protease
LFSIGNSGPSCNTANSPGDQNVIGVGSTTVDDAISSFSSVGPTSDGRMKPEIAAPGSNVISAYHTSDTAYVSLSGTSMACPHAAGTIALLQTRNKDLTYQQANQLLNRNTDQNLQFSGRVCDGVGDNQFPNHVFGNGRINALKSVRAQTLAMSQ